MQARSSTVIVSVAIWLWAGAATAADSMSRFNRDLPPQTSLPQMQAPIAAPSIDRDPMQSDDSMPARFFRAATIGRRSSANRHGFPASPPAFAALSIATAAPPTNSMSDNYASNGAFRFEHRGNVAREIPRGYNRMCDALSGHIWNEPDGKRLCFDMRGKPGISISIPIH